MKRMLIILGTICLLPNVSNAESFCEALRPCVVESIPKFDDHISPATTVAAAILSSCPSQTSLCIKDMQDDAVSKIPDRLRADGTYEWVGKSGIAEIEKKCVLMKAQISFVKL